ncbi:site-specific integrase [uncultured Duncaniella sp.]|uniref:site-specific integrase n=1 Tax=uncultured Duncaniella sp. TaxID=2768039 RepID=UPI00272D9849|nr:site-specific integrase [uncultured Duncaniella sp.]
MALKKNYRADNTYMISTDSTDNPKLGAKVLSDGRESLFLDFYLGFDMAISSKTGKEYKRVNNRREYLKLYLWQAPRTPMERQQNKETLEVAKRLRFERGQQLLEDAEGYRLKKDRDINFLDWMWSYYEAYTKADKRHIKRAYTVFIDFLNVTAEYSKFAKRIKPEHLTKDMMVAFTEYLQHRFKGEGAHTLYARFKKIIKSAVERDVMRKNPTTGVSIKIDNGALKKDVLSAEETIQLMETHYVGENPDIRRAFIFCLNTGLRWCDIKDLTYSNVDYSNKLLKFEQAKTKGHSSASSVVTPLNDGLLAIIGKPSTEGKRDELIFPLPSHTMCLKALRHWVKRAGIEKHITWHCARHSFAVNILNNGANIKTVASLLGHSGLKHTEKYTRAIDSLKQEAIDSLPTPKL